MIFLLSTFHKVYECIPLRNDDERQRMLFSEAIAKFSSWQSFSKRDNTRASYRVHLMHLALYLRNCAIESVKLDHILEYLEMMKEIGWDQNSYMVKCIAFRKFFEYFGKQGITKIDHELIPIVEREYKMPKVAKLDDFTQVLKAIPVNNDPRHIRNRAILLLFKDTGMRLGELLSLNVTDLNLEKMEALVKTEKTKKVHPLRKVFWTLETNDQLRLWITKLKTLTRIDKEALFVSCTGLKRGVRLNKGGVTEIMRRLSETAELGYVLNSHSLRHMFGHDLAKNKVTSNAISVMLGHASPVSSYAYTMMNSDEMHDIYAELRGKK